VPRPVKLGLINAMQRKGALNKMTTAARNTIDAETSTKPRLIARAPGREMKM